MSEVVPVAVVAAQLDGVAPDRVGRPLGLPAHRRPDGGAARGEQVVPLVDAAAGRGKPKSLMNPPVGTGQPQVPGTWIRDPTDGRRDRFIRLAVASAAAVLPLAAAIEAQVSPVCTT